MLLDEPPEFCWKTWTKSKFFCPKIAKFSPRAEQTDVTQACHRRGIVTKYLVTMDGGLEEEVIFAIL